MGCEPESSVGTMNRLERASLKYKKSNLITFDLEVADLSPS